MRRARQVFAGSLLLVLASSSIVTIVIRYLLYPSDGWEAAVVSLFYRTDTEFSTAYTETGFSRLKIGMSQKEVLDILGKPLDVFRVHSIDGGNSMGWRYTKSPGDHSYRVRVVIFEGEKVSRILSEFYVD